MGCVVPMQAPYPLAGISSATSASTRISMGDTYIRPLARIQRTIYLGEGIFLNTVYDPEMELRYKAMESSAASPTKRYRDPDPAPWKETFSGVAELSRALGKEIYFWDLETIGMLPRGQGPEETVGIVQIGMARVGVDGKAYWVFDTLIDPECPIPSGASAVHGIYDKDVAGAPTFRQVADKLHSVFGNLRAAGCGFNNWGFDEPYLKAVAARYQTRPLDCGPSLDARLVWTAQKVMKYGGGKLSEVAGHYVVQTGKAHNASGDVETLVRVVDSMVRKHKPDFILHHGYDRDAIKQRKMAEKQKMQENPDRPVWGSSATKNAPGPIYLPKEFDPLGFYQPEARAVQKGDHVIPGPDER